MLGYIARRILFAIPIAFGVSVVCFSLVYLAPGDPLQTILPSDATAEMVARSSTPMASIGRCRSSTCYGLATCSPAISACRSPRAGR